MYFFLFFFFFFEDVKSIQDVEMKSQKMGKKRVWECISILAFLTLSISFWSTLIKIRDLHHNFLVI